MDSPLIIGIKQYFKKMMKQYDSNLDGIIDRAELATVLNFREVELLPESPLNWESLIHDKKLKVYNPLINQWEIIYSFTYGYANFDNNGGGVWSKYINTPINTIPSEYAQYKIVIDSVNFSIYNSQGNLKTQADIASDFWNNVKPDGSDIRVFDQAKEQLYFWIEEFDYSNKKAVIWVNLTAGSSELNIAYGNPSATKSNYENPEQVFEFFDDFEGDSLDTNKWTLDTTYGSITIENGKMKIEDTSTSGSPSAKIVFATPIDYNIIVEWKWTLATDNTNTYYQVYDDSGDGYGSQARLSTAHDDIASYDGSTYHTIMTGVSVNTEYKIRNVIKLDSQREDWYVNDELKLADDVFANPMNNVKEIKFEGVDSDKTGTTYIDDVKILKLADPADFGTPQIVEF